MTLSNNKDTNNIEYFSLKNIKETHYESEYENTPRHSVAGKNKYLQQTLKSNYDFLLLLVMSYVGSRFKLLRISWYRSMKPFRKNIKLVLKKKLCSLHHYFPGVESFSNDVMLSGASKYIFYTISIQSFLNYI